jgi:hypothetical protein
MRTRTNRIFRRASLATGAAALLAASAGARADEPSPWYIGASQALTHDSNVYRIHDATADNYSTTSILGGFDQPIGRQRLHADARVGYNKYQDESRLDNTSYGVSGRWDWATAEKLTGSINAGATQGLASLSGNSLQPTTERNLLKTQNFNASARWGGDSVLTLFGNYGHSRVRYSAPESQSLDSTSDSGSVGLNYRVGADLTVGGAVRLTRTDLPHGVLISQSLDPLDPASYRSDTIDGRNLDFLVDWRYSARTSLNGRLSWTKRTYDRSNRDFSGLTGAVTANYEASSKVNLKATLSREAGDDASSFSYYDLTTGEQNTVASESSQTTDSLVLGATYAATAKLNAHANFRYRRTTYANNDARDNLRTARLGVDYAVARGWQVGCDVSRESRSASFNSYTANVFGCSAQVTLR